MKVYSKLSRAPELQWFTVVSCSTRPAAPCAGGLVGGCTRGTVIGEQELETGHGWGF
jgi:hypothetical protein